MRKIFLIAILFASVAFARAKNNCAALQSANAFHADSSNTIKQFSRNTYQKEWDLVDTKLAVSFDWKLCRMPGLATLKLTPHFFSTDSLVLDAKGFDIKKIVLFYIFRFCYAFEYLISVNPETVFIYIYWSLISFFCRWETALSSSSVLHVISSSQSIGKKSLKLSVLVLN